MYYKSNKGAFNAKGPARHNTLAQIIIPLQRKREAVEMRQTEAGWGKGDDKKSRRQRREEQRKPELKTETKMKWQRKRVLVPINSCLSGYTGVIACTCA